MHLLQNSPNARAGLVWIFSGLVLLCYAGLGFAEIKVPGVEDLVLFLNSLDGWFIVISAFLAVFLEGLYLIGNFFPGSTALIIIVLLAQSYGLSVFLSTMLAIYLGWSLAGVVNIYVAHKFSSKIQGANDGDTIGAVQDRILTTWFPVFRSNYEVQQIITGNHLKKVIASSLRVKLYVTFFLACLAFIGSFFIDINQLNNEEGFLSLIVIAAICLVVGFRQLQVKI